MIDTKGSMIMLYKLPHTALIKVLESKEKEGGQ